MGLIRAAVLTDYPVVARKLGLDPTAALRAVGLSHAAIEQPQQLISSDAMVRLLEDSAARTRCPSVGLQLAEMRKLSHFGVVSLLLAHQRTLRDVVQMGLQYLTLMNPSVALHLEDTGKTAVLHHVFLTDQPMAASQATELQAAAITKLFREIVGKDWRPSLVQFTHPAPASVDAHRRFFGCKLAFDAESNSIAFPNTDLDFFNPSGDPMMAVYARSLIDALPTPPSGSLVEDVNRLIHLFLPIGRATIEQVAHSLECNVRSLQRELGAAGTTFSALLNATRRNLAGGYLHNMRFDIGDVAALLGFARHGSFTRWFAREFGETPAAFRAKRASSAAVARDDARPTRIDE